MFKKFNEVLGKTKTAIQLYPMVLAAALLAVATLICHTEYDLVGGDSFIFLKVAIIAMLGISVFFSLTILAQRVGKQILFQIIGVLLLLIVFYQLPEKESDFTEVYAYFLIPVFLISHLSVSFIAFLSRKKDENFWQFNKNLFINFFLTIVFTAVLTGGVLLAMGAVDQLFNFKFQDRLYFYSAYFLLIFGSCFIFLLFNERGLPKLEQRDGYPKILKFFTQFILIPLLLIYAVILFLYSGKILVKWELPRGWVSYLVLAYSMVGILALLLVHPLKEMSKRSWVKVFSSVFYYSLIPLLILLYVAIFTRLLEYGFTEPRYFVLLLALWLTTVIFYFILIKNANIKYIPISLFVFGLVAIAFPYLNAFAVSKNSQKKELEKLLSAHQLLTKGKINFNIEIDPQIVYEIAGKFDFLSKRGEEAFLQKFLGALMAEKLHSNIVNSRFYLNHLLIQEAFGISISDSTLDDDVELNKTTLTSDNLETSVTDYQFLFKARNFVDNRFIFDKNVLSVPLSQNQETGFKIFLNGNEIDIQPELNQLFEDEKGEKLREVNNLFIVKSVGAAELKIIFDEISQINFSVAGKRYFVNSPSVIILVSVK